MYFAVFQSEMIVSHFREGNIPAKKSSVPTKYLKMLELK